MNNLFRKSSVMFLALLASATAMPMVKEEQPACVNQKTELFSKQTEMTPPLPSETESETASLDVAGQKSDNETDFQSNEKLPPLESDEDDPLPMLISDDEDNEGVKKYPKIILNFLDQYRNNAIDYLHGTVVDPLLNAIIGHKLDELKSLIEQKLPKDMNPLLRLVISIQLRNLRDLTYKCIKTPIDAKITQFYELIRKEETLPMSATNSATQAVEKIIPQKQTDGPAQKTNVAYINYDNDDEDAYNYYAHQPLAE